MSSLHRLHPVRHAALAALAAAGLLLVAETVAEPSAEQREHHRAACLLTRPNADVEACVEEAMAARAAARQGELREEDADPYRHNALQRCRALPVAEQPACEARIRGQGSTSGSVEEGGILRELVIREQGAPPAPALKTEPSDSSAPTTWQPAPHSPTR